MCAFIAQHGSALATLAALWQQPKAQQNDEQTNSLENLVPHIIAPAEFNQDTSESARERHNHLQRERRAKQHTKLAKPSKTPQDRSNHLCRKRQTVQQAIACA